MTRKKQLGDKALSIKQARGKFAKVKTDLLAEASATGYDGMAIPRVKGKRREVRRMLARRSQELLSRYRRGEPAPEGCPLARALASGISGR